MLVIYYGIDKAWDGAVHLYDMVEIEQKLKPYVTNYKMNLFDYHDYEDFSFFKTENRELFEILSCAKDEKKMNDLLHNNIERYRRLPADAVHTIFTLTGINLDTKKILDAEETEVVNMCKAWDDHKETGKIEGKASALVEAIDNLIINMNLSLEEACKAINSSVQRYEEAKNVLNK